MTPDTEIQPSFEEMWNGFVAMYRAIDDFNARYPDGLKPTPALVPCRNVAASQSLCDIDL